MHVNTSEIKVVGFFLDPLFLLKFAEFSLLLPFDGKLHLF
jgi:hypothetical protein